MKVLVELCTDTRHFFWEKQNLTVKFLTRKRPYIQSVTGSFFGVLPDEVGVHIVHAHLSNDNNFFMKVQSIASVKKSVYADQFADGIHRTLGFRAFKYWRFEVLLLDVRSSCTHAIRSGGEG